MPLASRCDFILAHTKQAGYKPSLKWKIQNCSKYDNDTKQGF